MTELEKIAYAKSFIDKLANGVNLIVKMNTKINEVFYGCTNYPQCKHTQSTK